MPSEALLFFRNEIEEEGENIVSQSGYLYVGRKYSGKNVLWVKLKEEGAETIAESK